MIQSATSLLAPVILALAFTAAVPVYATSDNLDPAFLSASAEFDVPSDLLKAIAFAETRWHHVVQNHSDHDDGHHQKVYGVMGLRDDDWFGHSLREAAA